MPRATSAFQPTRDQIFVICPQCHELRGGPIGVVDGATINQLCECTPALQRQAQRRVFDFNTAVEFCRCCATEALRSGSRWSVWFCEPCKNRVAKLNHDAGRCIVPIGRHSVVNGVFYNRNMTDSLAAVATQMVGLFGDMPRTAEWVRRVVTRNIKDAGLRSSAPVSIEAYRAGIARGRRVKKQRFDEMIDAWRFGTV